MRLNDRPTGGPTPVERRYHCGNLILLVWDIDHYQLVSCPIRAWGLTLVWFHPAFGFVLGQIGGWVFPAIAGIIAAAKGVQVWQPMLVGQLGAAAVSWLTNLYNPALHQDWESYTTFIVCFTGITECYFDVFWNLDVVHFIYDWIRRWRLWCLFPSGSMWILKDWNGRSTWVAEVHITEYGEN